MPAIRYMIAGAILALACTAAPAGAGWPTTGKSAPADAISDSATGDRQAAVDIAVPEPGNLGLFLAGVIGLAIGRRSSRIRRRKPD